MHLSALLILLTVLAGDVISTNKFAKCFGSVISKCVGGARWRIMVDQWSNLQRFSGFTRMDQI